MKYYLNLICTKSFQIITSKNNYKKRNQSFKQNIIFNFLKIFFAVLLYIL